MRATPRKFNFIWIIFHLKNVNKVFNNIQQQKHLLIGARIKVLRKKRFVYENKKTLMSAIINK